MGSMGTLSAAILCEEFHYTGLWEQPYKSLPSLMLDCVSDILGVFFSAASHCGMNSFRSV